MSNVISVRDTLELALEALKKAKEFCGTFTADECPDTVVIPVNEAIAALDEAIKQHGEPVAKIIRSTKRRIDMSDPSDFCIGCMNDEYPEGLRKEIESLRQQLVMYHLRDKVWSEAVKYRDEQIAEAVALRVCADHDANELANANELARQLVESQAEAKRYKAAWESSHNQAMQNGQAALESQALIAKMRLAIDAAEELAMKVGDASLAYGFKYILSLPSDSTALDLAIKQAKREALLEAAKSFTCMTYGLMPHDLRSMADKLK